MHGACGDSNYPSPGFPWIEFESHFIFGKLIQSADPMHPPPTGFPPPPPDDPMPSSHLQTVYPASSVSAPHPPSLPPPDPPPPRACGSKPKTTTRKTLTWGKRNHRSCALCSRSKIKCVVAPGASECRSCQDRGVACNVVVVAAAAAGGKRTREDDDGVGTGWEGMVSVFRTDVPAASMAVAGRNAAATAVPRLLTTYDDLAPLPDSDVRHFYFRASFQETHTMMGVLDRSTVLGLVGSTPTNGGVPVYPFLVLAVESLAATFCRRPDDAEALARRAGRDVTALMAEWEGVGHGGGDGMKIMVLQAVLFLGTYAMLAGKMGQGIVEVRWLATAIACARGMGMNREVWVGDPLERERRRRIWWYLYIIDGVRGVTMDNVPMIRDDECLHLKIMGCEYFWNHDSSQIAGDEAPTWGEVLNAFDEAAVTPTTNTTQSNPTVFPATTPLCFFWARDLSSVALLVRASALSRRVWRPLQPFPPTTAPDILALTTSCHTWLAAYAAFHQPGGTGPNSAGYYRAGKFARSHLFAAGMLATSPRWAVDAVFEEDGVSDEAEERERESALRCWVKESGHATECRKFLSMAVAFWREHLETWTAVRDLGEEERLRDTMPSFGPPSGGGLDEHFTMDSPRFYDTCLSFLVMLQWDITYAARIMTVLHAFSDPGPSFETEPDSSFLACASQFRPQSGGGECPDETCGDEAFSVLDAAARGMGTLSKGLRDKWEGLVAVRRRLLKKRTSMGGLRSGDGILG
ncbi:hypothetical protein HDU96_004320 [Phlyctochytrium bullatum]|nr:hypothetical protein HDU96_004320 [Phlyctochytrium bullatum]